MLANWHRWRITKVMDIRQHQPSHAPSLYIRWSIVWSWARKDNLTIHRAQTHTHRERKSEREQQHQHTHTSRYIGKKLFHSEPSATYRSPASKAFLYTHTQLPPPPSTPLSIQPAPNDFQFSSSFSLFFFPCCIILYYIIYRFLLPLQQRKERRVSYCYYSSGLLLL
jgi:hypothetical protein